MGNTAIEWTDKVWNPVTGCSKVSQGCKNCYAERVFPRPYPGRAFTDVRCHPERLEVPLGWRKPCRVFVNSMSDLFHESVPDEFIGRVFQAMEAAKHHTFQVLTKRPRRMRDFIDNTFGGSIEFHHHIWLGVSVENQETADERIPLLIQTPAAVRWISAEPLLGPVEIGLAGICPKDWHKGYTPLSDHLHWVVVGGESGPNARPMHPDWARSLRDECAQAGVAFFLKQWGEWAPGACANTPPQRTERVATWFGGKWDYGTLTPKASEETHADDEPDVYRLGKKAAGALLDGREHREMPRA